MPATDRFSLIVESATRGEAELRRFEETMNRLAGVVEQSQRRIATGATKAADESTRALREQERAAKEQERAAKDAMQAAEQTAASSARRFGLIAAGIAAYGAAVKNTLADSATYAARTQTLAVVTEQLARVNNLSTQAVLGQAKAVQGLGITTQDSLSVINRMIFAQLDVAKSTQLARVAQDAAVIAGKNSSEALDGIIHGIVTRQPEVLRTYGIVVNFEQEYAKAARRLGRDLLDTEKTQTAMNLVLREGAKITGTYEAAMGTAGKQLTSLQRYIDEASNAVGANFVPALGLGISKLTELFQWITKNNSAVATLGGGLALGGGVFGALALAGVPAPLAAVGGVAGFAAAPILSKLVNEAELKRIETDAKAAVVRVQQMQAELNASGARGEEYRLKFEALTGQLEQIRKSAAQRFAQIYALENVNINKSTQGFDTPFDVGMRGKSFLQVPAKIDLGGGVSVSRYDIAEQQVRMQRPELFTGGATFDAARAKAIENESLREQFAVKAKQAEQAVRDFVLRSFDSGLTALDRIAIEGAKQFAEAVTANQRERILSASRRMLDAALSEQSGRAFESRNRGRQTIFDADVAAAVSALESPNRGAPVFVGRPIENEGVSEQQRAFGEGLLNRDKQRLSILQQQVEFEARKTELLAGPGGEIAALERSIGLRLQAVDLQVQLGAAIDVQAEKTRILQDRELQLLEIQARRLSEFKANVQQAFDALVSGGGGGIRDFVKAQGLGVGRAIVGNVAGEFAGLGSALNLPGQRNADGTPNLFGRLLAGTPFASTDLKTATDRNTQATERNTQALLGGGATGSIAGALGLPGGLFSGSGSNPFIFSAQSSNGLPGMTGTAADSAVNRSIANQLGFKFGGGGSSNLMKGVGVAGLVAGSAFGAYSGFSAGGAQGALQGSSAILGGAGGLLAMLAPTTGPLAPILLGAALATGLGAALLGDPKQRRDKQINQLIEEAKFTGNDPMAYSMDLYGRSFDSNYLGNIRAGQQTIVVQVQAMDSKSFLDHSSDIADGVRYAMQQGHGLNQTARETVLGGM